VQSRRDRQLAPQRDLAIVDGKRGAFEGIDAQSTSQGRVDFQDLLFERRALRTLEMVGGQRTGRRAPIGRHHRYRSFAPLGEKIERDHRSRLFPQPDLQGTVRGHRRVTAACRLLGARAPLRYFPNPPIAGGIHSTSDGHGEKIAELLAHDGVGPGRRGDDQVARPESGAHVGRGGDPILVRGREGGCHHCVDRLGQGENDNQRSQHDGKPSPAQQIRVDEGSKAHSPAAYPKWPPASEPDTHRTYS